MLARAGCSTLAVVSSTAGTPSIVARERGFEIAAAEAGLKVTIARSGPTGYSTGFEAGRLLLSGSGRPDAAFCVTDLLACGFMDAARFEFGLIVPDRHLRGRLRRHRTGRLVGVQSHDFPSADRCNGRTHHEPHRRQRRRYG